MPLDNFMEVETDEKSDCSKCGDTGVLGFSEYPNSEPDKLLCGNCVYNSKGRFKNQRPSQILKEYESLDRTYVKNAEIAIIETDSFLGKFSHIFYLEDGIEVSNIDNSIRNEKHVDIRPIKVLSGKSEIFDSDENLVGGWSPYVDIAEKVVTAFNNRLYMITPQKLDSKLSSPKTKSTSKLIDS